MKRLTKKDIAMIFTTVMFAVVPIAGVAELLGKKDLARYFLWAGASSLVGVCFFIPEIKKEESSIAYQDIQTREFIADRISIEYPDFDTQKLVRRGARFMRQNIRLPIDTYDGQDCSDKHKAR